MYSLSFDGIRNRVDDIIIGFSLILTKDYFQISKEKKMFLEVLFPFKAGKRIPFHREFNQNNIFFLSLGTFWLKIQQFWLFEEISIFSHGSHLGYRTALTDTLLKGDHPRIISTKFGWDWLSSFRGEDFFLISYPLFSIFSLVAILVGSRDHRTQIWKGAIQGLFHQSLVATWKIAELALNNNHSLILYQSLRLFHFKIVNS